MSTRPLSYGVPLSPLDPWIAARIGSKGPRLISSALSNYQLARLRGTLRLARAKSAFYRRWRLKPEEITNMDDLASLPFTTPEDIQDDPLAFLCVSQDDIARVVTLDTSGTTGRPKRLYFTAADQELTIDFFKVGMSTFTRPGDSVLILLPVARPGSVGDLLFTALARLGAGGVPHGPVTDIDAALEVLAATGAEVVVGSPTQVLALARQPDAQRLAIRCALLTTDAVPASLAEAVEQAWGCTVFNHYGMTEMGLGGGVECQARRGYHLREADLLFEVVDPGTDRPLPEGETGEIVFTTLTRRGMPLIRYRTGDLSHFVPGPCPCGTALRTLAPVQSRIANRVSISERGTLTLAELDEALFAVPGLTDFRATMACETQDELFIDACTVSGADAPATSAIQAAVRKIPVIRQALEEGALSIRAQVSPQTSNAPPPLAKRLITDLR